MLVLHQLVTIENEHLMRTVYRIANNSKWFPALIILTGNIEARDRLERVKVRCPVAYVVLAAARAFRYEILVARPLVLCDRNVAHESRSHNDVTGARIDALLQNNVEV